MDEQLKINAKQKLFAEEYLIDLNATAAYKRAGYKGQGHSAEAAAQQLLRNIEVAKYIQSAMDKRAESIQITSKYVLETIVETIERCKQAKPVMRSNGDLVMVEDANGNLAAAYAFDSSAVLKGAELLGKHLKLFTDKTEVTGNVTVEILRFSGKS